MGQKWKQDHTSLTNHVVNCGANIFEPGSACPSLYQKARWKLQDRNKYEGQLLIE